MTMRRAGETDLDRTGDSRRGIGRDGIRDEPGERRSDSGCTALEDVEEGKELSCKRARLGGGKVI